MLLSLWEKQNLPRTGSITGAEEYAGDLGSKMPTENALMQLSVFAVSA